MCASFIQVVPWENVPDILEEEEEEEDGCANSWLVCPLPLLMALWIRLRIPDPLPPSSPWNCQKKNDKDEEKTQQIQKRRLFSNGVRSHDTIASIKSRDKDALGLKVVVVDDDPSSDWCSRRRLSFGWPSICWRLRGQCDVVGCSGHETQRRG